MLGKKVKDNVTGMIGIAVAKMTYMTGCVQYEVQPKKLKDGVPVASRWVDEENLDTIPVTKKKKSNPGGPGPSSTPKRGR